MSRMDFDLPLARSWIDAAADRVTAEHAELTALDSAIGDGDHGANLRRGFAAVRTALTERQPQTPGALLLLTGTTLISSVGGASGPLYGSAFRALGKALGDAPAADAAAFGAALAAALAAVERLGGAAPGDKTMVDALAPAVDAFQAAAAQGFAAAAATAADAAAKGRDATEPLVAHKGRASYLGPRSAGHIDPGAASAALLLAALAAVCAAGAEGAEEAGSA